MSPVITVVSVYLHGTDYRPEYIYGFGRIYCSECSSTVCYGCEWACYNCYQKLKTSMDTSDHDLAELGIIGHGTINTAQRSCFMLEYSGTQIGDGFKYIGACSHGYTTEHE